jgi:bidirectional [NiFe] hydrogenase diaphorase subunit
MEIQDLLEMAQQERKNKKKYSINCCSAAGCLACGSALVRNELELAVRSAGLETEVDIVGVGCLRLCGNGPLVECLPQGILYQQVTLDMAPSIVANLSGFPCESNIVNQKQPFFALQLSIALENCGKIDPESLESYVGSSHKGYQVLFKVLSEMRPEEVITEVTKSGLRGRGGAGRHARAPGKRRAQASARAGAMSQPPPGPSPGRRKEAAVPATARGRAETLTAR